MAGNFKSKRDLTPKFKTKIYVTKLNKSVSKIRLPPSDLWFFRGKLSGNLEGGSSKHNFFFSFQKATKNS